MSKHTKPRNKTPWLFALALLVFWASLSISTAVSEPDDNMQSTTLQLAPASSVQRLEITGYAASNYRYRWGSIDIAFTNAPNAAVRLELRGKNLPSSAQDLLTQQGNTLVLQAPAWTQDSNAEKHEAAQWWIERIVLPASVSQIHTAGDVKLYIKSAHESNTGKANADTNADSSADTNSDTNATTCPTPASGNMTGSNTTGASCSATCSKAPSPSTRLPALAVYANHVYIDNSLGIERLHITSPSLYQQCSNQPLGIINRHNFKSGSVDIASDRSIAIGQLHIEMADGSIELPPDFAPKALHLHTSPSVALTLRNIHALQQIRWQAISPERQEQLRLARPTSDPKLCTSTSTSVQPASASPVTPASSAARTAASSKAAASAAHAPSQPKQT